MDQRTRPDLLFQERARPPIRAPALRNYVLRLSSKKQHYESRQQQKSTERAEALRSKLRNSRVRFLWMSYCKYKLSAAGQQPAALVRRDASRFCRMRASGEDFAISAPVDTFTIGEIDQISIRRPPRFSRASFSVREQAYIAAICVH